MTVVIHVEDVELVRGGVTRVVDVECDKRYVAVFNDVGAELRSKDV
jgi:hypothetical protein